MPLYAYRCRHCTRTVDLPQRGLKPDCVCGKKMYRRFVVNLGGSAFEPHFNNAVGSYVSSPAQLDDELKKASDRQSQATGIEHNYARLDPGDMPRPQKDDHAFDVQAKAWRDKRAVS